MLSHEEQAAFLESIQKVRRRVTVRLISIQEPAPATAFISHLHGSIDSLVQDKTGQGLQIACKPGCAHCCHVRVEASEPEICYITTELKKRSSGELHTLIARLKHYVDESATQAAGSRRACAFLNDNLCSIYPYRPAVCRKAHSLSVASCENQADEIPQDLALILSAEAMIQGTMAAYADTGLSASSHELASAVLAALNDGQDIEK